MTAERFNTLDVSEQIRLALGCDTLIGHRSEGPRSMHLYLVHDFYVEVVYTTRRKQVLEVRASREDELIEPYLEQIDISELLFW